MRCWPVGLGACSLVATALATPVVIRVPDGDTDAFEAAVCQTNRAPSRRHEIILAFDGHYDFDFLAPPRITSGDKFHVQFGRCVGFDGPMFGESTVVVGDVRIRGRGAELKGYGLRVASGAHLEVEDVDFNLNSRDGLRAVHNRGTASLERVSIADGVATVVLHPEGPSPPELLGIAIHNEGQLRLRNVGIYNLTSPYRFPTGFDIPPPTCVPGGVAVYNRGELEMTHVTFSGHQVFDGLAECLAEDIFNQREGRVRLRNSAFLSQVAMTTGCFGPVESLGYNYFGRDRCAESLAATDVVGPAPFFDQRPRISGYRRAVVLPLDHPAVKQIPAAACAAQDLRDFPRAVNAARCDIGALERGAPPGANPGTVSGLWYQPEADGHYLQLSFVRPDEILLTWQTYDRAGTNLWIYGLGEATGHRLTMRLFRNFGPMADGGRIEGGAAAAEIGHATFSLTSCAEASFEFESEVDGLIAGRLDLKRLALTEGIDCDDGRGRDL